MVEDPLDHYRKLVEIHAAMDHGDVIPSEKGISVRAMGKAAAKMLSSGRDGADRFSVLLDDSRSHVALWAAHHLLDLGELDEPTKQRALRIIERASRGNDVNALGDRIWLEGKGKDAVPNLPLERT
jgi:hypothetical protein